MSPIEGEFRMHPPRTETRTIRVEKGEDGLEVKFFGGNYRVIIFPESDTTTGRVCIHELKQYGVEVKIGRGKKKLISPIDETIPVEKGKSVTVKGLNGILTLRAVKN